MSAGGNVSSDGSAGMQHSERCRMTESPAHIRRLRWCSVVHLNTLDGRYTHTNSNWNAIPRGAWEEAATTSVNELCSCSYYIDVSFSSAADNSVSSQSTVGDPVSRLSVDVRAYSAPVAPVCFAD